MLLQAPVADPPDHGGNDAACVRSLIASLWHNPHKKHMGAAPVLMRMPICSMEAAVLYLWMETGSPIWMALANVVLAFTGS